MKRILVLTPALNVHGGVANFYSSIKLNEEENIDYFYVGSKNSEVLSFPILRFLRFINFYRKLKSYDVILVNPSLNFKSFCRDSIYIWLAKSQKKKVYTFFRGWDTNFENFINKNWLFKKHFRATFGKTDEFILLGRVFEDSIKNILSHDIICHLVTTVADDTYIDLYRPMKERVKSQINILFLGRIVKGKGIIEAIGIINKINESVSNKLTLNILGDGPDFIDIKNKQSNDNIIFHGYLNGKEKYKIISNCHLLLFPTYYMEGLPNAILESMLFGLPIITTRVGGITDIIFDNVNGLIIKPFDQTNSINRILLLLKNEKQLINISEVNHSKAFTNYTSSKVRIRILKILSS